MNSLYFASSEAEPSAGGLAAFGVNWQMLLFQAITFLLVVWVLKKFVMGKVYEIIDARKAEIDEGLDRAEQAKKDLASAQDEIDTILGEARNQAEGIVASAKKESSEMIKAAEDKAVKRAEAIITDAQSKLAVDVEKARRSLQTETARLIGEVTETILHEKLTTEKDQKLIRNELEQRRA